MKITVTDDSNQVLFEKESTDPRAVAKVTAALHTPEERRALAMEQVAAIKARRTPEQVAEAERIAALTPEDRAVEYARQEKAPLETQLAESTVNVQTLQAAVARKAAPVGKVEP